MGCVCLAVLLFQLTSGGWILHENLCHWLRGHFYLPAEGFVIFLLLIRQPAVQTVTSPRSACPFILLPKLKNTFMWWTMSQLLIIKKRKKEIWLQIKGPKMMPTASFLPKSSSCGYITALSFPLLLTSFTLSTSKMSLSTYTEFYTNWFH